MLLKETELTSQFLFPKTKEFAHHPEDAKKKCNHSKYERESKVLIIRRAMGICHMLTLVEKVINPCEFAIMSYLNGST